MRAEIKALALGIAGSFAFAGAASAADLYVPPPVEAIAPAPALFSWTGGYLGVQGGYDWTDTDLIGGDDLEGGIAGLYAGWNWQAGSIVYGVEGNLNYSFADADFGGGVELESGLQGNVRGRLGVAFAERWLVYGTAGVAAANFDVDTPLGDDDDTGIGFTVGGGVEWAFADNASARLDYTYSNYDIDFGGADIDVDSHTLMLGVAWKMGGMGY